MYQFSFFPSPTRSIQYHELRAYTASSPRPMQEDDAVLALGPTFTLFRVAVFAGGGLRRRSPICLTVRERPRSRSGISTGRRGAALVAGAFPFRTCGGALRIKNVVPKATSTSAAASAKTASGKRATVVEYTIPNMTGCKIMQDIELSEQIRGWVMKDELTPRICPRAVSMLRPPKRAPISGLPCRERWRMQIARLCSAGMLPAARAEMLVTPVKNRGDQETCNATRVCDTMSRMSEARTTPRSEVIERARCARARLEGY